MSEPVAAAELREAAIGREAAANQAPVFRLTHHVGRFGACCAVDRSLAELGSGYRG
ncbi:hypothetical protein EMIT0P201_40584 [Pseudomonas chlororaphis]